ncbi:MAG: hypothetical protein IJ134_03705 [Bacilli bacterium]|nr:hypothetical protein [Bacilli bacterium]
MNKNLFHYKCSTILFLIISTILLLIYSLGYDDSFEPINYFSYLYSSFSLVVVICNIKRFYLYLKKKFLKTKLFNNINIFLNKNRLIKRYFDDIRFKNVINLSISAIINFSFIFINFINGILNKSIWFISVALYYFLLTIIRIILLNNLRKYNIKKEYKIYRNVGYFSLVLNVALVIMIIQMVHSNVAIVYDRYVIYLTATYTFYLIISAIINVFVYKKYNSPILSSVKVINLLTSSVSILILQTTMIATFGENDLKYMQLMNGITGAAISLLTIGVSIYMIKKSYRKI